jgi:hypothetical protein
MAGIGSVSLSWNLQCPLGRPTMHKIKLCAAATVLGILSTVCLAQNKTACPDISSSPARELASFLAIHAHLLDPTCTKKIIVQLGNAKEKSAVTVLIALLSFRRPDNQDEKQGLFSLEDKYPAVESLFQIGQPAVPALVSAIASERADLIARQNALRALEEINSEEPSKAILVLKAAARKSKSRSEASRLHAAATQVMSYCGKQWHNSCLAALQKNE